MIWNGEVITGAEKVTFQLFRYNLSNRVYQIKDFLAKMPESKHEIQSWDCHPIPGVFCLSSIVPILITPLIRVYTGTYSYNRLRYRDSRFCTSQDPTDEKARSFTTHFLSDIRTCARGKINSARSYSSSAWRG